MESPNSAKSEWLVSSGPESFEIRHLAGNAEFVPFVYYVEQVTAFVATGANFVDTKGSIAIDVQALLESMVDVIFGGSDGGSGYGRHFVDFPIGGGWMSLKCVVF
jgi:hypothetical protein